MKTICGDPLGPRLINMEKTNSPTLGCVLQLRISRPQWVFFNGVKGHTGVIVQSDPSISINGSLLLGQR